MKKHPNDMDREELRKLVSAMSWQALDLAQNLNFIGHMLKEEYKEQAFESAIKQAYNLSNLPYTTDDLVESRIDIAVFGQNGMEKPFSFWNREKAREYEF